MEEKRSGTLGSLHGIWIIPDPWLTRTLKASDLKTLWRVVCRVALSQRALPIAVAPEHPRWAPGSLFSSWAGLLDI